MNEYEVKQIIEYVNDESVSDHYGKWGTLNRDQRKKIRDLCNSWEIINEHDKEMTKENQRLKELYRKTCEHLFNIGNDELARYFQAQIDECPTFFV